MRQLKLILDSLKLVGLMAVETLAITYPVAALTFWLCYLGDIWWGDHLMVKTADKCFTVCLILGLGCGLGYTIYHTRKVIAEMRGARQSNSAAN